MFEFQKLSVYQKAKDFNKEVSSLVKNRDFELYLEEELKKNTFSIMLNIAEASSKISDTAKWESVQDAKGSVYKCMAILDYIKDTMQIDEFTYLDFHEKLEEISTMLTSLIRKLDN